MGLGWVVIFGLSGVRHASPAIQIAGLFAVIVSGTAITISLLSAKKLHDAGISSESVTFVRYLLLILVAVAIEATRAPPPDRLNLDNIGSLAIATTLLMVLPLFALQVGIAHTHPITSHIIRALGPALILAFEQRDRRISYSAPTLALVLIYSVFSIVGSVFELRRKRDISTKTA